MKLETILSACIKATYDAASGLTNNPVKIRRQQATFRDRIIRMFEDKNVELDIAKRRYKNLDKSYREQEKIHQFYVDAYFKGKKK